MINAESEKIDTFALVNEIVNDDIDDDEDLSSSDEEFEVKASSYDEEEAQRALKEIMKAYYEKRAALENK